MSGSDDMSHDTCERKHHDNSAASPLELYKKRKPRTRRGHETRRSTNPLALLALVCTRNSSSLSSDSRALCPSAESGPLSAHTNSWRALSKASHAERLPRCPSARPVVPRAGSSLAADSTRVLGSRAGPRHDERSATQSSAAPPLISSTAPLLSRRRAGCRR